jgi:4-amino-4-deoxy-L-arabinose transferase-like glycosyltransferase
MVLQDIKDGTVMKRLRSLFTLPVIGIFGLALIVRVAYNIIGAQNYFPLHDSETYQSIAFNLLQEHCYCLLPHLPTVDRAPLWPAIIAAIYGALGAHDRTVRLFLSVVGSCTCVLTYLFAKDLFHKRIGIFAGLLAAIYPFLFLYDAWLYSESLYIFLLLAFCYTLYHLQRAPGRGKMLLGGILLGLLSLTRPNGLAILALFLVWAFIIWRAKLLPRRDVIRSAVIVTLVSLVLVTPWTIRNYAVTHTLVPVAVGDGKVLIGAYNDDIVNPTYQNGYYLGTWLRPQESTPSVFNQFPSNCAGACEVQRDDTYRNDAKQWALSHVDKLPYLLGLHIANLWQTTSQEADMPINRFPTRPASELVVAMMEIITPIVLILSALGLVLTWKRWRELLFIYFMIALTIVQCIYFYGIPRFRAPIEPMLIILASGAIWQVLTWFTRRRKSEQTTSNVKEEVMAQVSRQ